MRLRRFFALPHAPIDRLNFDLAAEVYVYPSIFVRTQTRKFKRYSLSIFRNAQFEFLVCTALSISDANEMNVVDSFAGIEAILWS